MSIYNSYRTNFFSKTSFENETWIPIGVIYSLGTSIVSRLKNFKRRGINILNGHNLVYRPTDKCKTKCIPCLQRGAWKWKLYLIQMLVNPVLIYVQMGIKTKKSIENKTLIDLLSLHLSPVYPFRQPYTQMPVVCWHVWFIQNLLQYLPQLLPYLPSLQPVQKLKNNTINN